MRERRHAQHKQVVSSRVVASLVAANLLGEGEEDPRIRPGLASPTSTLSRLCPDLVLDQRTGSCDPEDACAHAWSNGSNDSGYGGPCEISKLLGVGRADDEDHDSGVRGEDRFNGQRVRSDPFVLG